MPNVHLAQVNIAWMHSPIDDPAMSGLAGRVDEMNRLAEASRGFVWRLPGAEVTPASLEPFECDFPKFHRDRLFYNLSVWETLIDLRSYTFGSDHAQMLNNRHQWVDHIAKASMALWWIPIGHRPTIAESAERLRSVHNLGPTAYAFTIRKSFQP